MSGEDLDKQLGQLLSGDASQLPATAGIFAPMFREILLQRNVTVMMWTLLMHDYVQRIALSSPESSFDRQQLRENLTRDLIGEHMTETTFLKGLNMLGVHKIRLTVEAKNVTGEHQVYVSPHYVVRQLP